MFFVETVDNFVNNLISPSF